MRKGRVHPEDLLCFADQSAIIITEDDLNTGARVILGTCGIMDCEPADLLARDIQESIWMLCELVRICRALHTLGLDGAASAACRVRDDFRDYWARYGVYIPPGWLPVRGRVYHCKAWKTACVTANGYERAEERHRSRRLNGTR